MTLPEQFVEANTRVAECNGHVGYGFSSEEMQEIVNEIAGQVVRSLERLDMDVSIQSVLGGSISISLCTGIELALMRFDEAGILERATDVNPDFDAETLRKNQ